MPGVVDGVRGLFVSAAETIVGVDGLDVECEDFSFLARDDERQGGIGTEDIPEDIAEENK